MMSIRSFFRSSLGISCFYAAIIILAYWGSWKSYFVFDDITGILRKTAITHPKHIHDIWIANPSRFFTNLTFAANYRWEGVSVLGYHLVNMLIHLAVGIVIFGWIQLITKRRFLSFFVALLFLIHPMQTESVAYISQRSTSLAALWYMSSLWSWMRWMMHKGKKEYLWLLILSFACEIAALLTKEYTYTLPLAVVLISFYFFSEKRVYTDALTISLGGFFLIALIVYLSARASVFGGGTILQAVPSLTAQSTTGSSAISSYTYLLTQGSVILSYVRLLFLPVGQTVDHNIPFVQSIFQANVLVSWSIIIVIVFVAYVWRKRWPLISFGILFFLITLSAESSLFPISDAMMEHRVYLPSIGIFLSFAVCWEAIRVRQILRPWLWYVASAVIVLALLEATYQRTIIWSSNVLLWDEATRRSPQSSRAHFNLGGALIEYGYSEAGLKELDRSGSLNPTLQPAVRTIRGLIYQEQGSK